jgi:hypothetical protein
MAEPNDTKPLDETPAEQTEQRTDDYDGLARRLDDVLEKLNDMAAVLGSISDLVKISNAPDVVVSPDTDATDDTDTDGVDVIDLDNPIADWDLSLK